MKDTTKEVEEIVEEFDSNLFNDDGWNMRMYSETKNWLVKTLTTLTTKHQEELKKAVEAERGRIIKLIEKLYVSIIKRRKKSM